MSEDALQAYLICTGKGGPEEGCYYLSGVLDGGRSAQHAIGNVTTALVVACAYAAALSVFYLIRVWRARKWYRY